MGVGMGYFDVVVEENSGVCFYVIDDLKKAAFPIHRFYSFKEALDKFEGLDADALAVPTLGVEAGAGCVDLVQRVNGDNVLLREYQRDNLSQDVEEIRPVLDKIAAYLVEENWVQWMYSDDFFDRIGRACPVVVPVGKLDGGFDSNYCADKRLKTISGFGFDAINQLYMPGHGWVEYRDVQEDPEAYADNGFLCVEGVNVNYSLKTNFVGLDGQMDITANDFSRMLADVNKEFSLRVYDRELDNSYIVSSYDDLGDAVRAWYAVPAEYVAQVNQTVGYSYQQIVFNGVDESFEEIPINRAAEMYGFALDEKPLREKFLDEKLSDARGKAVVTGQWGQRGIEREGIF